MQTIHARNMKKSAFIRSQLEASKIGQKVQKIFLNKSAAGMHHTPPLDIFNAKTIILKKFQ